MKHRNNIGHPIAHPSSDFHYIAVNENSILVGMTVDRTETKAFSNWLEKYKNSTIYLAPNQFLIDIDASLPISKEQLERLELAVTKVLA